MHPTVAPPSLPRVLSGLQSIKPDFCRLMQGRSRERRDLPHSSQVASHSFWHIWESRGLYHTTVLSPTAACSRILDPFLYGLDIWSIISPVTCHNLATLVSTVVTRTITSSGRAGDRGSPSEETEHGVFLCQDILGSLWLIFPFHSGIPPL